MKKLKEVDALFTIILITLMIGLVISIYTDECKGDEPIIVTEFHGRHDSITVGTVGDDALNLYTQGSQEDSITIGTAGDQVILINRRSSRFNPRPDIKVNEDLILIEDLRNPLEERRDE